MAYKSQRQQSEYVKKHYQLNKDAYKRGSAINRVRVKAINKKYILEYLSSHPCIDCGESDTVVLEFDHVRGEKKYNIADIGDRSLRTLINEIAKCEVRCANCHRRVTHVRRQKKRDGEMVSQRSHNPQLSVRPRLPQLFD